MNKRWLSIAIIQTLLLIAFIAFPLFFLILGDIPMKSFRSWMIWGIFLSLIVSTITSWRLIKLNTRPASGLEFILVVLPYLILFLAPLVAWGLRSFGLKLWL